MNTKKGIMVNGFVQILRPYNLSIESLANEVYLCRNTLYKCNIGLQSMQKDVVVRLIELSKEHIKEMNEFVERIEKQL